MALELKLGPRVCIVLNEMQRLVTLLLREATAMCRAHHKDATQLQTSSQRLQSIAQLVARSSADLNALMKEVGEVEEVAKRIEKTETDIQTVKQKVFSQIENDEKRAKELRELVRTLRQREKIMAATSVDATGGLLGGGNGVASGIPLDELLRYAKRITNATTLRPNYYGDLIPTNHPSAEDMKRSILHDPKKFAVVQQQQPNAAAAASGGGAVPPQLDLANNVSGSSTGPDGLLSPMATPGGLVRLRCVLFAPVSFFNCVSFPSAPVITAFATPHLHSLTPRSKLHVLSFIYCYFFFFF